MTFIANEQGVRDLFNSPEGPVAKALGREAVRVESLAKIYATGHTQVEGAINPEKRGPRVRTDRLRSSITWVYGRDEAGLYAAVGTNVYYGRYLELGFVSSAGNFFRYPFLKPALMAVAV